MYDAAAATIPRTFARTDWPFQDKSDLSRDLKHSVFLLINPNTWASASARVVFSCYYFNQLTQSRQTSPTYQVCSSCLLMVSASSGMPLTSAWLARSGKDFSPKEIAVVEIWHLLHSVYPFSQAEAAITIDSLLLAPLWDCFYYLDHGQKGAAAVGTEGMWLSLGEPGTRLRLPFTMTAATLCTRSCGNLTCTLPKSLQRKLGAAPPPT